GELVDATTESRRWHPPPAADFDMVAAREIELLVVPPPRHEQVHAAGAILVVRNPVHQLRDETGDAEPGRVGQVLADDAARVGQALGGFRSAGVECAGGRLSL